MQQMQTMTLSQGRGQNANQTKLKTDLNIYLLYFILISKLLTLKWTCFQM